MSRTMSRSRFRALRAHVGRLETELAAAERRAREEVEVQLAGGQARIAGRTAATNPHPIGTAHRRAWSDGWNAEHRRLGARRAA